MTPRTPKRQTPTALAATLVACTAVSGCFAEIAAGTAGAGGLYLLQHPEAMPLEDWSNVPARREPKAHEVQYQHDVGFVDDEVGLIAAEGQDLEAFIDRARVGLGDRVYVLAGVPEGEDRAQARRISERRRDSVVTFLGLQGIEVRPMHGDFGVEPPAGDAVTVLLRRYVVALPACPDWTGKPGRSFNNQVSSNWGCATAINFGLMVADPGDLVHGQRPGLADGERMARSVERYRKGETKSLTPEDIGTIESQQKVVSGDSAAEK